MAIQAETAPAQSRAVIPALVVEMPAALPLALAWLIVYPVPSEYGEKIAVSDPEVEVNTPFESAVGKPAPTPLRSLFAMVGFPFAIVIIGSPLNETVVVALFPSSGAALGKVAAWVHAAARSTKRAR